MLTHEQIEMLTDAEADRRLAEKVMGWTLSTGTHFPEYWMGPNGAPQAHGYDLNQDPTNEWHPHRDLNQAIESVGKLGFFMRLENQANSSVGSEWVCVVRFSIGRASTPARAVCNAVIAADHEASHK